MKKALFVLSFLSITLLFGCERSHLSPTEQFLLKYGKVDRTNSNLDKQSIERVESLASSVKSWESIFSIEERMPTDISYPWQDVYLSILSNPDSVKFLTDKCYICNNRSLVELYFKSPSCTWDQLCGRAGDMTICTECKKQVKFKVTLMN